MRTFIDSGSSVDVVAPAPIAAGQLVVVGTLLGVATTTAATGDTVALKRGGVFELPKASNEAWTVGAKVYLDATTGFVTVATANAASAPNTLIGRAAEPAANPSGVGRVLLSDFVGV